MDTVTQLADLPHGKVARVDFNKIHSTLSGIQIAEQSINKLVLHDTAGKRYEFKNVNIDIVAELDESSLPFRLAQLIDESDGWKEYTGDKK